MKYRIGKSVEKVVPGENTLKKADQLRLRKIGEQGVVDKLSILVFQ